jgi:hypothetical protein
VPSKCRQRRKIEAQKKNRAEEHRLDIFEHAPQEEAERLRCAAGRRYCLGEVDDERDMIAYLSVDVLFEQTYLFICNMHVFGWIEDEVDMKTRVAIPAPILRCRALSPVRFATMLMPRAL